MIDGIPNRPLYFYQKGIIEFPFQYGCNRKNDLPITHVMGRMIYLCRVIPISNNVLLVKIALGRFLVYDLSSPVKGVSKQTPLLINQPTGKGHLWIPISWIPILVGGFNVPLLWKMMEFVSWDDEIPNIWKNKKWSKPPTSNIFGSILVRISN